jgi:hypothetical protein
MNAMSVDVPALKLAIELMRRASRPLALIGFPSQARKPSMTRGDGLTGIDRELTDCFEIVNVKRG